MSSCAVIVERLQVLLVCCESLNDLIDCSDHGLLVLGLQLGDVSGESVAESSDCDGLGAGSVSETEHQEIVVGSDCKRFVELVDLLGLNTNR